MILGQLSEKQKEEGMKNRKVKLVLKICQHFIFKQDSQLSPVFCNEDNSNDVSKINCTSKTTRQLRYILGKMHETQIQYCF